MERRTKRGCAILLLTIILGGCTTNGDDGGNHASNKGSAGNSTHARPAPNNPGIVLVSATPSACSITVANPDTGDAVVISTFRVTPAEVPCNSSEPSKPILYSSNFDKLATKSRDGSQVGWLDSEGQFHGVVSALDPIPGSGHSAFPLGFDKNDNFYYQVGNDQIYRTMAQNPGPGELVGSNSDNSVFGFAPGGNLTFGAHSSIYPWENCNHGDPGTVGQTVIIYDSVEDPDRTIPYYYVKNDTLYRDTGFCELKGEEVAPKFNFTVHSLAVSPDGTRVAITTNLSDIFIIDTTGRGEQRRISLKKAFGNIPFGIRGWR